jgi:branched-subunit amino acid ABC-type transport system permease component
MNDLAPFVIIGLTSGSAYALAGTGLVLTYKTAGLFNFAHGIIAAAIAYAFYDLRIRQGLPWPVALALCLLVLTPVLALAFELVGRRLADANAATKVVATVGILIALRQVLIIRYGSATSRSPAFLPTRTVSVLGVNVGVDQLIVISIALAATVGLAQLFRRTAIGRQMRGVVDDQELLALLGSNPIQVRRIAWCIGTSFAGLSGILLAPTVGLDADVLTLLVVQAFGAAAIGMFRSIGWTYAGGLAVGVVAAVSTKYVTSYPSLAGLPSSLPFIVLFVVLLAAPRRWLADLTQERRLRVREARRLSAKARVMLVLVLASITLVLPNVVGPKLPVYSTAAAYSLILLSLALLIRTSGLTSLAQLSFAAVGAAISARLTGEGGLPWPLAVLAGAMVAVPVGAVLAVPAIRRSGLYLALATFGFAVLLERMVFGTSLMFGGGAGSLSAARPSFAGSDEAYFYLLAGAVAAGAGLVAVVHRSRLGRLLRAMADSEAALIASGTNVTLVKIEVFCLSAFLAGLGGALLAPVTGAATPGTFGTFSSLLLVVVLALFPGAEIFAAVAAAVALEVLPIYITSESLLDYLPLAFGCAAVTFSILEAGATVPARLVRAAAARRSHPERSRLRIRAIATGGVGR